MMSCPNCGTRTTFYNPCNQRGCPVCYQKNQLIWKENLKKRLAPVSHYHLTFSIPQRYTELWQREKRTVVDGLFKGVSKAIKEMEKEEGIKLGSVLAFQSHGRGMSYKPHMHCILTAGGLDSENNWVDIGSIKYRELEEKVEQYFQEEIQNKIQETAHEEVKRKDWRVYATYHHESGNRIAEYLARSYGGVVIDIEKGFKEYTESGMVKIEEEHNGEKVETILNKRTFLERYLNHIPPAGTVMVRYYGVYANRHRKELEKINEIFDRQNETEWESEQIIEKCPVCKTTMKVDFIIFPQSESELVQRIRFVNGPPKHKQIVVMA